MANPNDPKHPTNANNPETDMNDNNPNAPKTTTNANNEDSAMSHTPFDTTDGDYPEFTTEQSRDNVGETSEIPDLLTVLRHEARRWCSGDMPEETYDTVETVSDEDVLPGAYPNNGDWDWDMAPSVRRVITASWKYPDFWQCEAAKANFRGNPDTAYNVAQKRTSSIKSRVQAWQPHDALGLQYTNDSGHFRAFSTYNLDFFRVTETVWSGGDSWGRRTDKHGQALDIRDDSYTDMDYVTRERAPCTLRYTGYPGSRVRFLTDTMF